MDRDFEKAKEEFITQRLNYHGGNEPEAVNNAFMALRSATGQLRETLTEEQVLLLRECENAYRLSDGETKD